MKSTIGQFIYCTDCSAIANSTKNEKLTYAYKGIVRASNIYELISKTEEVSEWVDNGQSVYNYNYFSFNKLRNGIQAIGKTQNGVEGYECSICHEFTTDWNSHKEIHGNVVSNEDFTIPEDFYLQAEKSEYALDQEGKKISRQIVANDAEAIDKTKNGVNGYGCSKCSKFFENYEAWEEHKVAHDYKKTQYKYLRIIRQYDIWLGCGNAFDQWASISGLARTCAFMGTGHEDGQQQEQIKWTLKKETYKEAVCIDITLDGTIEITKEWEDFENANNVRPETLHFNVYRSIDQKNWELLQENTDYKITIRDADKNTTQWKIYITGLAKEDEKGNSYYFKVEEAEIECYTPEYPNGNYPQIEGNDTSYGYLTIKNKLKNVNISGYVWLDGQTGIKPSVPNNGIMDENEAKLENIVVYLYRKNVTTDEKCKVAETVTDKNGYYEFKDYEAGYYYVEFKYDGIHYEDTIQVENGSSKAFENINNVTDIDRRSVFNARFQTITYKKSNDGTVLDYKYANKKSELMTNEEGKTTIKQEFQMTAETPLELITVNVDNLNLGLVKRGTDLALSTDVYDAKVMINGQTTDYNYSGEEDLKLVWNEERQEWLIGENQTNETGVTYNLNLYASDYNYRIRNYVNTQEFKEKDYINGENPEGLTTGDDLKVYVTYKVNLQNQSTKTAKINEVKYTYDTKYTFMGLSEGSFEAQNDGNVITINLNGLELKEGETKTIYLVFEVNETENSAMLGDFSNKAEITSYSTEEGLIDVDSQPGNFTNDNEIEDDNDTAGGLKIQLSEQDRKITGKVFDNDNSQSPVNDVIVQLIELKPYNGKVYEYIWQETVTGTEKGLRLNGDGTALEEYAYTKADGYYEFKGMIPGDYIVRFIYGDGTTYDMTGNVIKYNGQDYKSIADASYNAEWYNTSVYEEGASVARDNEARRLETMTYSVEINAEKGVLLKLLDNKTPDTLNETEKEILIETYNNYYDPDITEITQEVINRLLKEQTLKNTWMCAETSKIKVSVDTEDVSNLSEALKVNGRDTSTYKNSYTNINLGLELRPETKIELKKYITGFKLVASNGQTLVNAYIDVNEYLNGETDISGKVQGIKDHVTILDTVWQYEVAPVDINNVVDGANLEFEYTLVVRNTGEDDYLSEELANAYNTGSIADYKTLLTNKANELKTAIRNGTYRTQIGNALGNKYYVGGTGTGKVLTEVLEIRDYVNNDLDFVFKYEGKVDVDEGATKTHRILRADYSMQEATIDTILKTTESTGKMGNTDNVVMYTVTLGKNPISSTGNLSFENYIAEVMSFTNAAGRRSNSSTPGNAEIIDHEYREGKAHEIDEADTARIQIGAATGEASIINNIIIIAVVAGIAILATGAFVVKKHVIK